MRHPRHRAAIAVGLLLFALAADALVAPRSAVAATGETGFAFLKLGVGARAMALGGAYVALADDPTAIYWNPAGLAGLAGTQVTAVHDSWIQDFREEFVAVTAKLGPGAIGFGYTGFYSSSEFERRDDTGVLIGEFGFNDQAISGAYGLRVAKGLEAGVTASYVREMIDQESAGTFSSNLGLRYALEDTGLMFGGAIQNLGGSAAFITEDFSLPLTYSLGAAYGREFQEGKGRAMVTAEYRQASSENGHFNVGAEYVFKRTAALRGGWKTGYDEQEWSLGLGISHSWYSFDYAFVPFSSDLGTANIFALSGRF